MGHATSRTGLYVLCLAAVTLSTAASEPAGAPSAGPVPRVAVLHGTYDHQRHHQEHDAVLQQLGWSVTKFALTDVDRLVADLGRFDMVLGNPLFNYGPDTRDFSVHAQAWRAFLERGGAIVLTDCNYPGCVDWLGRIDASCAAATAPCKTDQPASEATPPHPLHSLPNEVTGRNSWQHLVLPDTGWEVITRCGDGQTTAAAHPLGAGLLVVTSNWPVRATELENVWSNVRLRRLGIAATRFARAADGHWQGAVSVGLRRSQGEAKAATLRMTVKPATGQPRSTTAGGKLTGDTETVLRLPYRVHREDDGGRLQLSLDVMGQTVVLLDQTLALPPLLAVQVRRPAYRGTALASTWPGEVVLSAVVTPDAEDVRELTLGVQVCAAAGSEMGRLERQAVPQGEATLRVPLASPAPGTYVARTELRRDASVLAAVECQLNVLPTGPATVVIDQERSLVVDGTPFFPLGMYHVGEADLPAVAALGINTVQGWGGNLARARRFLDTAQANDLKVLLEMGGMVGQKVDREAIEAHVQAFKDHPALLAWYVRDEPSPAQQPLVREASALFRRLDAAHPTYLVSCRPAEFAAEAHLADIFAVDPYPLPRGAIATVAKWADEACKAARGELPVWLIPQAHDNTSYDRKPPERGANPPTAAQERCMVYQCLIHGAKGIVWYTWDDGPNMGAKYHPTMQAAIRELCGEIRLLAPWLLHGRQRRFTAAEGSVHGLVCVAPEGRCLLVVNTAGEAVTAAFDVEEALPGQVYTPLGGCEPVVTGPGKRLTLPLPPLAGQAFRF